MYYSFESKVRFSEVNHTKQITLPGIINYFQDCSTFHSESLGLGIDYFAEHNRAWILCSWQVIIERCPLIGEDITICTWATKFKGLYGYRNFCMKDMKGNNVAFANSVWVYMDTEKGHPVKPKPKEIEAYGTEPELLMEYEDRKIKLPDSMTEGSVFPIRKYHIDTNEHVNNCQYVQMALEAIEQEMHVRQVRVEYKKSAVYKNVIIPWTAMEEDRIVTALCDEDRNPYAVVEFKEN